MKIGIYRVIAGHNPINAENWFPGFESGQLMAALSKESLQQLLDGTCVYERTYKDPMWDEYKPRAYGPVQELTYGDHVKLKGIEATWEVVGVLLGLLMLDEVGGSAIIRLSPMEVERYGY